MWQHLVEEYARHNGHADLLRETIDGSASSTRICFEHLWR
jgi:hypothetical protein